MQTFLYLPLCRPFSRPPFLPRSGSRSAHPRHAARRGYPSSRWRGSVRHRCARPQPVAIFAFRQASTVRLKILRNRSSPQALANARQARMIRQLLVKRIASKPANGDIDVSLAHQLAVMDDASQQASKHQTDRHLGIDTGPTIVATNSNQRPRRAATTNRERDRHARAHGRQEQAAVAIQ